MFTTIITEKVQLRLLEERHTQDLFELVRSERSRLAVWCPWLDRVATLDKTREFIKEKLQRFANGNGFTAGFFENGRLCGAIALEYIDHPNLTTEVGYWLDSSIEGRGLVTAACRRLIDHAFDELKLERVQIRCAAENARSRAIPEKLGFSKEGVVRQCERLPDRSVDLMIYGLLRSEWKSVG